MPLQNSKTYIKDLDATIEHIIGVDKLIGKSVLVTGATGTIGSFVIDVLLRFNQISSSQIKVYVAGRNIKALQEQFLYWNDKNFTAVQYDMLNQILFDFPVDYIIHAAGNAHPTSFNGDPVGTIVGNINSTYNLLQYAMSHGGKRLLFVSSGEVYGQGDINLEEFPEEYLGYIDLSSPRSCYPQSKRGSENLCASFSSQYGLETVVVRPCHTYGPQITPNDSRATAQFIRNVLKDEDIVLKSAGSQMRSYNYIADCVSGLLTVLINGKSGEAYNLANPNARITIAQFAEIAAKIAGKNVIFKEPSIVDVANRSPIQRQVLSSKKLESLGWKDAFSAEDGIRHTLLTLQNQ